MAISYIDDDLLTGIATAIRGKNGSSDTYTPAQMATAITNIPTGGGGSSATEAMAKIAFNQTLDDSEKLSIAAEDFPTLSGAYPDIQSYAFAYNKILKSIELPANTRYIFSNAFSSCTADVTIKTPKTTYDLNLGQRCFSAMNGSSIDLRSGNVRMPDTYIFQACNAKTIKLGLASSETLNGSAYAFYNCSKLETLEVYGGAPTILQQYWLYNCSKLTSLYIENQSSITQIQTYALSGVGLSSIVLPPNVTTIGMYAMQGCANLERVEIGDAISTITGFVWANCTKLKTLIINATTPPTLNNTNCFNNTHADLAIYVPDASVSDYQSATNWTTLSSKIKPLSQLPS